MGMYKYYKDLPSWAKGIALIGAGAVVFIIGSKVYKMVFPSEQEKKNRELANNVQNEIDKHSRTGMNPSFQDSNYNTLANSIYEAMRYAVGDNYDLVVTSMGKMNNDLDVAKLIKAFGSKQDYVFGIPDGNPKDLFTFVQSELGADYGGLTNYRIKKINEDWAKKGITYKL